MKKIYVLMVILCSFLITNTAFAEWPWQKKKPAPVAKGAAPVVKEGPEAEMVESSEETQTEEEEEANDNEKPKVVIVEGEAASNSLSPIVRAPSPLPVAPRSQNIPRATQVQAPRVYLPPRVDKLPQVPRAPQIPKRNDER